MSLEISAAKPLASEGTGAGISFEERISAGALVRRGFMAGLILPFLIDSGWLLVDQKGLFGAGLGVVVRELTIIVSLVGFLLVNTWTLHRINLERRKATNSLKIARDSLQLWVEEQARIEAELRDSDRRYHFLADAMPQIVWTARNDGGTEYTNRRWSDYSGQTEEEAKGWGWTPMIHPDDLERCSQLWELARASGKNYEVEFRIRRVDGEYRWHLSRAEPMRDETGAIVRWFGTCTDIDDHKRVETELRSSREGLADRVSERTAELEAANRALVAEVAERKLAEEAATAASRAKGEFLANMSHEIRTPMNGILGMTELALSTSLSTTQREYLGLVASSADSLLTVINDILDFSKIEAGKLELDPVPFSIRDAVTDTLRSLALRAHDKRLELLCRIAPEVPRSVVGDPGRLRQILVNLIGNAIKFTERGEVVVSVSVAEKSRDDPPDVDASTFRLRISVSDTGIGIPVDKRASIFAAFEQADGSTTRKYGGTGLGLAISSKLVALMGGSIVVEDNPGGGSLFQFEASFDVDPQLDIPPVDPAAIRGLRVLVVDDNQTNRRILREVLTQWGCRPVAVAGGDEALAESSDAIDRGEPYPVVLLDRSMPRMDGLELAARLRGWESASTSTSTSTSTRVDPNLKIVMLTSGGFDNQLDLPEADQVDGWLHKPVRQSELLNLLLDLLTPPRASGPPLVQADNVDDSRRTLSTERDADAVRPLLILLAEDHPINQQVATRMIENLGHRVVVVGDGRLAVQASASRRFDLVLMDVQMPEMDGFEALAAIRGRELVEAEAATRRGEPIRPHLPIVALTAHAMIGDRERCLNAGFDDYLSKPVHAAKLRGVFARIAPNSPSRPGPASAPCSQVAEAPRFDRRVALEAMGGDEALLDGVIRLFLDDTPRLLDQIRGAIDRDDHLALGRLGHTIAGVAANLGPNAVVRAARRVEEVAKTRSNPAEAKASARDLDRAFDRFQALLLAEAGVCP